MRGGQKHKAFRWRMTQKARVGQEWGDLHFLLEHQRGAVSSRWAFMKRPFLDGSVGMEFENERECVWPPTARKLQRTRVLVHGKVMQLKVALRVNSQPDKNRMVTVKAQQAPLPALSVITNATSDNLRPKTQKGIQRRTDWSSGCPGPHLSVYMTLPLLHSLSSRFGVVIQWASDFLEFLKKVSGIQILPTMLLLSMSSFMELLNFSRLSYHVWAKKMSMVYSCGGREQKPSRRAGGRSSLHVVWQKFKVSTFSLGHKFILTHKQE